MKKLRTQGYTSLFICLVFSIFALLELTIEMPILPSNYCSKEELKHFLALQITVKVAVMPLHFFSPFYLPIVFAVCLLLPWFVLAFLNYKVRGQGRAGKDRTGRDGTGRDGTGRDGTGRDGTGRDGTGRDRIGYVMHA